MKRMKRYFLLCMIGLCAVCSSLNAQDKKNMFNPEQYSVPALIIAPDARGGSMGDIGAATEADANSQYWNPAPGLCQRFLPYWRLSGGQCFS